MLLSFIFIQRWGLGKLVVMETTWLSVRKDFLYGLLTHFPREADAWMFTSIRPCVLKVVTLPQARRLQGNFISTKLRSECSMQSLSSSLPVFAVVVEMPMTKAVLSYLILSFHFFPHSPHKVFSLCIGYPQLFVYTRNLPNLSFINTLASHNPISSVKA